MKPGHDEATAGPVGADPGGWKAAAAHECLLENEGISEHRPMARPATPSQPPNDDGETLFVVPPRPVDPELKLPRLC